MPFGFQNTSKFFFFFVMKLHGRLWAGILIFWKKESMDVRKRNMKLKFAVCFDILKLGCSLLDGAKPVKQEKTDHLYPPYCHLSLLEFGQSAIHSVDSNLYVELHAHKLVLSPHDASFWLTKIWSSVSLILLYINWLYTASITPLYRNLSNFQGMFITKR